MVPLPWTEVLRRWLIERNSAKHVRVTATSTLVLVLVTDLVLSTVATTTAACCGS
jgi:hypothetical protein